MCFPSSPHSRGCKCIQCIDKTYHGGAGGRSHPVNAPPPSRNITHTNTIVFLYTTQIMEEQEEWREVVLALPHYDPAELRWALATVRSRSFAGPHFSIPTSEFPGSGR